MPEVRDWKWAVAGRAAKPRSSAPDTSADNV